MTYWVLREIKETTDGRVWAEWDTVADDGLRLIEGDWLTPRGNDLETEVAEWLQAKQAKREEINAKPKAVKPPGPRYKRTTAKIDDVAFKRLQGKLARDW